MEQTVFEAIKESITALLKVDYKTYPEENRERIQEKFVEEYTEYMDVIDNPEKYKLKIDKRKEAEFEEDIISRVVELGLFESTDELVQQIKDYKLFQQDMEDLERKYAEPKKTKRKKKKARAGVVGGRAFEECAYCGTLIDVKHGSGSEALVMHEGKPYHKKCFDEVLGEEAERRAGTIWQINGELITCAYCGDFIYEDQAMIPECEDSSPKLSSEYCLFYHAGAPPYNCWEKVQAKRG